MIEVKPYEKNTKKHSQEQLYRIALSIQKVGWQQPIKVGKDGVIIAGHGRFLSYKKYKDEMNLPEPWIIDEEGETVSGSAESRKLTEEEEKFYRLFDNLSSSQDYDMELANEEISLLSNPLQQMLNFGNEFETKKEDVQEEEHITDEAYMAYLNNSVRQVVLHYPESEYVDLIEKINWLQKHMGLETQSDLFKELIFKELVEKNYAALNSNKEEPGL